MNAGESQQIDSPMALYEKPVNRFVAGFIGSPAMNFILGRLDAQEGLRFISSDAQLSLRLTSLPPGLPAAPRDVVLGIRPEHVRLRSRETHGQLTLDLVEPMGSELIVYLRSAAHEIVARTPPCTLPAAGSAVDVAFDLDRVHFFDPASDRAFTA
jgi:multiple sugar transport system ATP-binding protein